ncbi:MAG: glycosyltransferase [Sphingomonadales bacterium]|nr:glycosyltransferase [Sphingomonadales bacterium]
MLRILILSALWPPRIVGGAEIAAQALALQLVRAGHEVGVLMRTDDAKNAAEWDVRQGDGVRLFQTRVERPYDAFFSERTPGMVEKARWHLQDVLDPRNIGALDRVLDDFRPDVVNIHILQGLGYNLLQRLAVRNVPTVYTLHDLGLACVRTLLVRNGQNCQTLCTTCAVSSHIKQRGVRAHHRLAFVAPSHSVLDRLGGLGLLGDHPRHHVPNAIEYPIATTAPPGDGVARMVFVGRIHPDKGPRIACEVVARLHRQGRAVKLDLFGSGIEMEQLRSDYAGMEDVIHFHGYRPMQEIADAMGRADLFLAPTKADNAPGSIIHALQVGLPVIASRVGGIPEYVQPGKTGWLLTPEDIDAWTNQVAAALDDPAMLKAMRESSREQSARLNADRSAAQMVQIFEQVSCRA